MDESTSRDGDCGISAFVISLLALLKGGAIQEGHIHRGSQAAVLETMPARAASDTGSRCINIGWRSKLPRAVESTGACS